MGFVMYAEILLRPSDGDFHALDQFWMNALQFGQTLSTQYVTHDVLLKVRLHPRSPRWAEEECG